MALPTSARWKPAISASPSRASTTPSKAVAIRPPVRATALLKPEAVPTWRSVDRAEHRRGQRRDRDRHPRRHHRHRREDAGPVTGVGADALAEQHSGGDDQRADDEEPARADPPGELAHRRRGEGEQDRQREHRQSRLDRRIAAGLDQHIGDQQHRRAECAVEQEGQQVEPREAAVGEHRERHHRRVAAPRLDRTGTPRA